jgi:hypothetical protein
MHEMILPPAWVNDSKIQKFNDSTGAAPVEFLNH